MPLTGAARTSRVAWLRLCLCLWLFALCVCLWLSTCASLSRSLSLSLSRSCSLAISARLCVVLSFVMICARAANLPTHRLVCLTSRPDAMHPWFLTNHWLRPSFHYLNVTFKRPKLAAGSLCSPEMEELLMRNGEKETVNPTLHQGIDAPPATVLHLKNAPRVGETNVNYASWTIDSSYNRGFVHTDFTNQNLLAAAKTLQPSTIRFGGGGNDYLQYVEFGTTLTCRQ